MILIYFCDNLTVVSDGAILYSFFDDFLTLALGWPVLY